MQPIQTTVAAHTFTTLYSELEDRLRLVINYADYANRIDFWITRAFLLKLAPSWEEYSYRYAAPKIMSNNESVQNLPNNTATDSSTLAVTHKEGVLLEAVDMMFEVSVGTFEIRLRGKGTEAVAILNEEMMITLIKTIFNAAPHIQWGVSSKLMEN